MALYNNQLQGVNNLPAPQLEQQPQRGFLGSLKDFFVGSPGKQQQLPLLNPQQQQLQSLAGTQATSMLGNLGSNQFDFAPIAQQARTNFQTKTLPSIASRFAGMGNQRGSDYPHALASAGVGLEEGLAALQAKYDFAQGSQSQQLNQQLLLALLSHALQPQNENVFYPGQGGLLQALLPAAGQATTGGIMNILKLIGLG